MANTPTTKFQSKIEARTTIDGACIVFNDEYHLTVMTDDMVITYHRFLPFEGSYKDWHNFRASVVSCKNLTVAKICQYATKFDINYLAKPNMEKWRKYAK